MSSTDEDKKNIIKAMFEKCDANKDGKLTVPELKAVFGKLGEWTDEEFQVLFDTVDKNKDGVIVMSEFLDWVFPVQMEQLKDLAKNCGVSPDAALAQKDTPVLKKTAKGTPIFEKSNGKLVKDGEGVVTVKGSSSTFKSWDGCFGIYVKDGTEIVHAVGGSGDFLDADQIWFDKTITGVESGVHDETPPYGGKVGNQDKVCLIVTQGEAEETWCIQVGKPGVDLTIEGIWKQN
eukprot:gnl/MRDRNA2_/MRDRNA2_64157_c0_seq1.p1 gnl/MRDRNA2_/MRDRNA2_64157_c0~~gnl/MRDRNA2_/MRDRNA2_64157_c0_seq1.p1  ORF type:complete len:233 (+),score=46.29 gnl/MRDRNA2_/MRDRNA2_64157_c0_seq1:113-811(+)